MSPLRRLGAHRLASNRASQMRGSTRFSGDSGGRPEMVVNAAALGGGGGAGTAGVGGAVVGAVAGAVAGAVVVAGAFAGGAISRAAMAAPMSM